MGPGQAGKRNAVIQIGKIKTTVSVTTRASFLYGLQVLVSF